MLHTGTRIFQKGLDLATPREQRHNERLHIRRRDRESHLQKKRKTSREAETVNGGDNDNDIQMASPINNINDVLKYINSPSSQSSCVIVLRKILSEGDDSSIIRLVCEHEIGIIPTVISLLFSNNHELYFECLWIIINITSGSHEQTAQCVKNGAINACTNIILNNHSGVESNKLIEHSIWALGNIAADCNEYRVMIAKTQIVEMLLEGLCSLDFKNGENIFSNTIWMINNLIKFSSDNFKKQLFKNTTKQLFCVLEKMILQSANKYALRCISYLVNTVNIDIITYNNGIFIKSCVQYLSIERNKYYNELQNNNKTPKTVLLGLNDITIASCLKIMYGILNDDDTFGVRESLILELNFGAIISPYLTHFIAMERKKTFIAMSTFLAGNSKIIDVILNQKTFMETLMNTAINDKMIVRKAAIKCINNATIQAVPKQMEKLLKFGSITAICKILNPINIIDNNTLIDSCRTLEKFLNIFNTKCAMEIEELNGFDFLEQRAMQSTLPQNTANMIFGLIKYWNEYDTIAPTKQDVGIDQNISTASINWNVNCYSVHSSREM